MTSPTFRSRTFISLSLFRPPLQKHVSCDSSSLNLSQDPLGPRLEVLPRVAALSSSSYRL